jgi:hypothetical protein
VGVLEHILLDIYIHDGYTHGVSSRELESEDLVPLPDTTFDILMAVAEDDRRSHSGGRQTHGGHAQAECRHLVITESVDGHKALPCYVRRKGANLNETIWNTSNKIRE